MIDSQFFTNLLNNNYKTLFSKRRAYAAFNDTTHSKQEITPEKCAKALADAGIGEVLDPMSGYGTITNYGDKYYFSSFMVELNLPAHLWQLLVNNEYNLLLNETIKSILQKKEQWIQSKKLFEVSDNWIGSTGLTILTGLYLQNRDLLVGKTSDVILAQKLALSLILPFVMRLSTAQKGDANHIKVGGGVAVLDGYMADYEYYLKAIVQKKLNEVFENHKQIKMQLHTVKNTNVYADAVTYDFPKGRFKGMLTSPPYPNGIDYAKMFSVENYFIEYLKCNDYIDFEVLDAPIIGTNIVKGRKDALYNLKAETAVNFLDRLANLKLKKDSKYDMDAYYLPYFRNYFCDIEQAYLNVVGALANDFVGYIVVTNNCVRNIEVPVSSFIMELWQLAGFRVESISEKEVAHIGTKNQYSKGRMARHSEHIIKVWRTK